MAFTTARTSMLRGRPPGFPSGITNPPTPIGEIPTKVPKVSQARNFGIMGHPLDGDPLDSLLIRLFNRVRDRPHVSTHSGRGTTFRRNGCRIQSVLSPQNRPTEQEPILRAAEL